MKWLLTQREKDIIHGIFSRLPAGITGEAQAT